MSADRLKAKNLFWNTILFGTTLCMMLVACLMTVAGHEWDETAACTLFVANVVLNAAMFQDLFRNIRRDFPLIVFMLAYDLLLLGRVYSVFLLYYNTILSYLEADNFYNLYLGLMIVTIAQLLVYTAYKLAAPLFWKREKAISEKGEQVVTKSPIVPIIRQISVVVLLFSSVASFYMLFQTILLVFQHGYLGSYVTNESSVPSVISRMSAFFAPSFAVFLATLPSRRQMRFPLILYGAYMLTSLLTGRRNIFVCELLMLLIYEVLRTALKRKGRFALPKKKILLVVLCCAVGAYVLQLFALFRSGSSFAAKNFFATIGNFIYTQGASFRVVIQTVNFWNRFDHQTTYQYLFYPFEKYVNNNVLLSSIFGSSPIVDVQNINFVSSTHNFAHIITFMANPNRYLSGGGFGTSFVAEAYVAYGMVGVVVVSAMVGIVFRFFSSLLTRNWVVIAMGLIALKDFIYISRNSTFSWVIDVFSLTYLAYYIVVYFGALLVAKFTSHLREAREASLAPLEEHT
jgi:oligosaccharide repeat unit polymerase